LKEGLAWYRKYGTSMEFYNSLEQRGFKRHKLKTGVIVSGLCLRKEEL
jgi:hypothetical protein